MKRLREVLALLDTLVMDHDRLLQNVDGSNRRVVSVETTSQRLMSLTPKQQKLLNEALSCAGEGFYRAAIVIAWVAVIDRVLTILEDDHFQRLGVARGRWPQVATREELTETQTEHAIIEAFGDAKFITKGLRKTLLGQLHTRNQAAHPTDYDPTFNAALGFVEGAVSSLVALENAK